MTILQAFKATMIDLDKASAMSNSTVPIQAETLKKKAKKRKKKAGATLHVLYQATWDFTLFNFCKCLGTRTATAPVQIAKEYFAPDFRREGEFVPGRVWHDRYRLGNEIGRNLGIMSLVCLVFYGIFILLGYLYVYLYGL